MRKNSRIITLAVAAAVMMAVTACGSKDKTETTASTEATTEAVTTTGAETTASEAESTEEEDQAEEEEMDEADYTTFQETTKAVYYDEAYTFSKESQEIIELYSGQTDEIEEWAARYAESISPWEWLIRDKVTFE